MFQRNKRHGASLRIERTPEQWKGIWLRRLRWSVIAIAVVAMGMGIYRTWEWLLDPGQFPLRHVRLEGELLNLQKAELEQILQGYLGQNFFILDIDGLYAALAANPWIEQVTVRRQWPDTLRIQFREHIPFGFWGKDEMVDIHGERFRPSHVRQPGPWPHLVGPDGHEMTLIQVYREASDLLNAVELHLVSLEQDERRAWRMTFANGLELNLGRERLSERLRRFIAVYPRLLSAQVERVARVDLRYINGFAVRWKPASAGS
jgi:cell division protein FtsQ